MENEKFDPHAALQSQFRERELEREFIGHAIYLIENDQPNAAARHLQSMLEGAVRKIMFEENRATN